MNNFITRFENYVPRKSCKGCEHYINGDRHIDKCLKIECDDRCVDEQICMDDIKHFYQYGRSDAIEEIYTQLWDEIAILNEHDMNEDNLMAFAYRIKDIAEQLEEQNE